MSLLLINSAYRDQLKYTVTPTYPKTWELILKYFIKFIKFLLWKISILLQNFVYTWISILSLLSMDSAYRDLLKYAVTPTYPKTWVIFLKKFKKKNYKF